MLLRFKANGALLLLFLAIFAGILDVAYCDNTVGTLPGEGGSSQTNVPLQSDTRAIRERAALSNLLATAASTNVHESTDAMLALGRMRPSPPEFFPLVLKLARDTNVNESIRYNAASAVNELIERGLLDSKPSDGNGRRQARKDSKEKKEATSLFIELLKDPDSNLQALAMIAVVNLHAQDAVPTLLELYKTADEKGQVQIIHFLRTIGPRSAIVIPVLTEALGDPAKVAAAIEMIETIGKPARTTAPALIQIIRDKGQQKEVRKAAIRALHSVYPQDPDAIPAYLQVLEEPDAGLQYETVGELGTFQEMAAPAMPLLLKLYDSTGDMLRFQIIGCWAGIGPQAAQALPSLITALKGKNKLLSAEALIAISRMRQAGAAAAPDLIEIIQGDADPRLRQSAAVALISVIPRDAKGVSICISLLKDRDEQMRWFAIEGIAERGTNAAEAVPSLVALYPTETVAGRLRIINCFGSIGGQATSAVPLLASALKDQSKTRSGELLRSWAAHALGEIGPEAGDAVVALTKVLQDPEDSVRLHAVEALGKIGARANAAIPDIQYLLNDPDYQVRQMAGSALKKIASAKLN